MLGSVCRADRLAYLALLRGATGTGALLALRSCGTERCIGDEGWGDENVIEFPQRVRAVAPASIGNLGPGLDVLGCAVTGAGDSVMAEWCDAPGVVVRDPGHPELPTDAAL